MKINLFDLLPPPEELAKTIDLNLLEIQIFGDVESETGNDYPNGNVDSKYSSKNPSQSTNFLEIGFYMTQSKRRTSRHVNKNWSFDLSSKSTLNHIKGEFQTC